jgi:hypothetical protein
MTSRQKAFKIISIMPILSTESPRAQLVAVTSTGIRLYFSAYPAYGVKKFM